MTRAAAGSPCSRCRRLTVVIAPDSFKGSLPATAVAAAIAAGWSELRPDDTLVLLPQADGGEGTLDAIATAVPDAVRRSAGTVTGPDGRPTPGEWLELPGQVAVVELAGASGLPLMAKPDPLGAQTTGVGEVIAAALDAGATSVIIGLGGSASTDGGAGALRALGLDLRDGDGAPLPQGGGALGRLATIDRSLLRPPPPGGVTLLTDVDAPLLGDRGAAAVFGPQKGATADQVRDLDTALAHFAATLGSPYAGDPATLGSVFAGDPATLGSPYAGDPSAPGAGAAGGAGFGFAAVWHARLIGGADRVAELSGLGERLAGADLLITGEGRFDATSVTGKVVGQAMARGGRHGVDVAVIAGQMAAVPTDAGGRMLPSWALTDVAGGFEAAMADPVRALTEAGRRAAAHRSTLDGSTLDRRTR